ncbi:MAG: Cyclophilin type peptidyl-prolyl cis-trans isomerase/CLD [Acidobacteriota bacterium]
MAPSPWRGATPPTAARPTSSCAWGRSRRWTSAAARAADGQGFAAFGRVMQGMDVVRRIQAGRTNEREQLIAPIRIVRVYRQQ